MTTLRLNRLDRLKKTHTNKRKRNGASDSDVKVGLCPTSFSFCFAGCAEVKSYRKIQEQKEGWDRTERKKRRVFGPLLSPARHHSLYKLQQSDTHEVHTCPAVHVDVFE